MWRYRGIRDSKPPLQIGEFLIVGTSRMRLVWCPLRWDAELGGMRTDFVGIGYEQG